ncbi:MAG: GerMN domain-containing protein, partial [Christensenellales bacterium]
MKSKSKAALALVLAMGLSLTACARQDRRTESEPQPTQAASMDILPYSNAAGTDARNLTLYFGYGQEDCLVPVSRQVEVSADERVEKALIEEMIKGPADSDSLDLTPLINPETQVVSVSNRSGYLFITLSQEFLNAPVEIPKGMEEDVAWQEQVNRVRRLSVDALVNAITELGAYTHIYLLVDDGTGQGVRILREQVGYLVNGQLPLEPMVRNA